MNVTLPPTQKDNGPDLVTVKLGCGTKAIDIGVEIAVHPVPLLVITE